MFCDAKDCSNIVEYLRIIKTNKGTEIRFNLCAECNKLNWKLYEANSETSKINVSEENK